MYAVNVSIPSQIPNQPTQIVIFPSMETPLVIPERKSKVPFDTQNFGFYILLIFEIGVLLYIPGWPRTGTDTFDPTF